MGILWKYGVLAALLASIVGAGWYGIHKVEQAFTERDALQIQVEKDKAVVREAQQQANDARQQAQTVADKLQEEIRARELIAKTANMRHDQIMKDLTHAKRQLAQWQKNATPELAKCLDMVVPAESGSVLQP